MKEKSIKYKIILILFSLAAFLPNLGHKSADIMEARNFVTAREMILYNNWLIPTMNGSYRFEKPPLPTWITAATMKLFNDTSTEWIMRLPAVLMSIIFVLMLYSFISFISKNYKLGFITSLIGLSSFFIMEEGIANTWDIFAYALAFGYVLYLTKGLKTGKVGYFLISSIFLGFSFLSKGPVALYGLILPFFIAFSYTYGMSKLKQYWVLILFSLILGIIIGSSWYIYMLIANKELFLQVMNKEVNTWDSRSVKGFFFYFGYLKSIGIWIIFAIASLLLPFKFNILSKEEKKIYYLGIIWTLISLFLISFIKMKKERYAIPLYMTTPIFIAPILYYFSSILSERLEKIFKNIIFAHWLILFLINTAIPFLFYFRGVQSDVISIKSVVIIGIISIIFNILLLNNLKNNKNVGNFYTLIILTSILGIFFYKCKEELLQISVLIKQKENLKILSSFKSQNNILPLHSSEENITIEEVWQIGNRINLSSYNLESEFIYISIFDNLDMTKFQGYALIKKEIMYRSKNGKSKVYLFWLKKI